MDPLHSLSCLNMGEVIHTCNYISDNSIFTNGKLLFTTTDVEYHHGDGVNQVKSTIQIAKTRITGWVPVGDKKIRMLLRVEGAEAEQREIIDFEFETEAGRNLVARALRNLDGVNFPTPASTFESLDGEGAGEDPLD